MTFLYQQISTHLRFEFVTAKRKEDGSNPCDMELPLKLKDKDTQVCPWRIPLKVVTPQRILSEQSQHEDKATMIMEMNRISGSNDSNKRSVWL